MTRLPYGLVIRRCSLLVVPGLLWLGTSFYALGQNTREVELKKAREELKRRDQRLTRSYHRRKTNVKRLRRESVKDYRKRVERQRKAYEEAYSERERDPRYHDPEYFGHKKKPKKRPLGERKLCEECGIVH